MIFITWFVFAILVAFYASSKGRSGFGFFILSVILSPLIGGLIAMVVSPINSEVENKALKSGEMKKCSSCAELVKIEAIICKHCRTELPAI